MIDNFLHQQYEETDAKSINHNYLAEQFGDYEEIFAKLAEVVRKGDFTLGRAVDDFESRFAEVSGSRFAIGVGSGTDALFLSLKALGVGDSTNDEVITTPFTFYATIGAIVTAGARPVFVDIRDDYNIDPELIEPAITPNTKAILPVHWAGKVCDMDVINSIAEKHSVAVVEDACHAITAKYKSRFAGSFGSTGCFSMHPLKNLNVWGDGGVICTQSEELGNRLRLMRNHGLSGRDKCEIFSYNSRLDTVQAVVADHLLDKLPDITQKRIAHAQVFDEALKELPDVTIPPRDPEKFHQVYHIYSLRFNYRDELKNYLESNGVDAKIHYPIPMHLQPAAKQFRYKRGNFPKAEAVANSTLSLPIHEFITHEQQEKVIELIKEFYK